MTEEKKKSGFDLFNEAQQLLASCPSDADIEADPEAEEAWTELLLAWADSSDQKGEAYRAVRDAATARAEHFKAQATTYQRYAKREERICDRIESITVLLLHGAEDVKGAAELECSDGTTIKLRRRKNKKVDVTDEAAVPESFIRVKRSIDKASAGKALKAGEEIPGIVLLETMSEWVAWK